MRNALCSTLTLCAVALAAGRTSAQVPDNVTARVDQIFAKYTSSTPGCAVAAASNDQTVLSRAYGMADLEHDVPNTPETIFEAGSVSKQFTAAAVILLVQRGKLSLDDDVRKYIPEVPDFGHTITIRHLLTHTSGLRDWGEVAAVAGWPRTTRTHTHAHVLDLVAHQKALNYTPGAEYSYTNTGYNLLVMIVDRISGSSFTEFTRKELFQPLGMTHTQWRDDYTRIVKGRAQGYTTEKDGTQHLLMPFENVYGNGGLLTTVGDLLLWNANLNSGKLGGAAFVTEMQHQMVLNSGRQIQYARGLVVTDYNGLREISHSGATAAYRAFLARYPDQKLSVALLCNSANANPGGLAHQVVDVFLKDAFPVAEAPHKAELSAGVLAAFSGLYRSPRTMDVFQLAAANGGLRIENGPALTPLSSEAFQVGNGKERIQFQNLRNGVPADMVVFMADGDTIRFERQPAYSPGPDRVAAYLGDYYSDEAEVTYSVASEGGALVLKRRPDYSVPLRPQSPDIFSSDVGLIKFDRNSAGKIIGFGLWAPRIRDMRFTRVTPREKRK